MKRPYVILCASVLSGFFSVSSVFSQQVTHIPTTDRALPGAPAAQFSIGAEDGEDWELLSRVSQVAFDAKENLYVLDGGNNRVLVFGPNGKFIRKIGKKGGGPGELMTPVGLAITRDGYIAVTDMGRPGVSLFKSDGSFVKNIVMGDSLGFPSPVNGTLAHPNAGVVVRANPIFTRGLSGTPGNLTASTAPRTSPILWLGANGTIKNLYSITLPQVTPKVTDSGSGSGRRNVMVRVAQPAFSPPLLWTVLPNGSVAYADEAGYKVKLVNNGKVQRVIQRDFPVRKVTERDKDAAREARRKNMKSGVGMVRMEARTGSGGTSRSISTGPGGGGLPAAEIENMIREMTFLDQVPLLQRMAVDPKGRLWIERVGRQYGDDGPIDIIDGAGRYVGTINGKMPDAISPSGRAAYIERDDMDVEKVVVRALPKTWM